MNAKRYVASVVAVLVWMTASGWFLNDVLMKDLYIATANLWRPADIIQRLLPFIHLANFVFALLFCFIYTKGYEGKGTAGEGFRYGLLVALLLNLPEAIMLPVYLPWPRELFVGMFAGGTVQTTVAGVITGLIYRKPAA